MTKLRKNILIFALLFGSVVPLEAEAVTGLRRQHRCHVACSSCVDNSASHSDTNDGILRKQSPRPLPEGVTAVTSEQLVDKVPNFFFFDYQFPPEVGKRVWLRINDHQFVERYPSGKQTTFNVLGRATVEQFEGTLVIRVDQEGKEPNPAAPDAFRVFIPDKTLESHRLYYSYPQINSGDWVYFGEMQSVE